VSRVFVTQNYRWPAVDFVGMFSRGRRVRRRLGRSFIRLWAGFSLASSGDGLALGAVPLLAVLVNPHPVAVSAVVAADNIPWLIIALPAGAFADRFERGPVMAVSNVVRALVILTAALLVVNGQMKLWLLILIVLVSASARAIYYSSLQAMVPDLVKSEELEHANGVLGATEASTEHLSGPIVGSWLFAIGNSIPFFIEGIMFVLSCVPFVKFRTKAPQSSGSSPSMWEGARLLFADRHMRFLILLVASLSGLQGMESGVLVLLATTVWGVSTGAYGLFLAVIAVGNLLGSVAVDRLVKRFGSAQTLIGAGVISGVGYLIMASATGWQLAAPAAALVGVAVGVGSISANALRQRLTPPEVMGRVGAAWRGIVWGAAPVGAIAAGSLAAIYSLRLPIALAGVLQIAVVLVLAGPLLRSVHGNLGPATGAEGGIGGSGQALPAADDDAAGLPPESG
jgi:MFS family permease